MTLCLCLFAASHTAWAKKKKRKVFAPPKLTCPQGLSNLGPETVVYKTYSMGPDEKLLICVLPEEMEKGHLKGKYLYQYEAALFRHNKFVQRVFSGSQKTPVILKKQGGELFEIMHLNFRDEFYPLYKEKISCLENECRRMDKVCVYDQTLLSPMGPREFEREKVIYGKGASQIQDVTDADLAQMANLAMRGRRLAVEFFTDLKPKPKLIGSANEFYSHMQALLNEMREAGCLTLQ
jgi:hypothetical protein